MALLAGEPFFISPSELMEMDLSELRYWEGRAYRRHELIKLAE